MLGKIYSWLLRLPRIIRYGTVGAICAVIQLVILQLIVRMLNITSGELKFVANGVAFLFSVQVNFWLSTIFTWPDRLVNDSNLLTRWIAFNGSNLFILLINQGIFGLLVNKIPDVLASGVALIVGTAINYLINYFLIFAKRQGTRKEMKVLANIRRLHQEYELGDIYVSILAFIIGALASLFYVSHGFSNYYADAQSHLMIARRVLDNSSGQFDLAQLGGVWLPVTHLWALPLVTDNTLYQTGLAGVYISMFSFFLCSVYLFKLVKLLTGNRLIAFIGALMFIINPNVLYMASTAMTEVPMYMFVTASIYYLARFGAEPTNRRWLFWTAVTIALATGIRYETWIILALEGLVVIYIYFRDHMSWVKLQSRLIWFGIVAGLLVIGWLIWNQTIFGNAFEFQTGSYAKPALWVSATDPVIHNLPLSLDMYYQSVLLTIGPALFLAVLGLILYLIKNRIAASKAAPLILLVIFPFYVANLYMGQRPMKVPTINNGEIYNIRFGLFMVIPVVIFASYLLTISPRKLIRIGLAVVVIVSGFALYLTSPITLDEGVVQAQAPDRIAEVAAGNWIKQCYDGGILVGENYGNEPFVYSSQIDLAKFIYEGSYQVWDAASKFPWKFADWVFMHGYDPSQGVNADSVYTWQHDSKNFNNFTANYHLVYTNGVFQIWRKTTTQISTDPKCDSHLKSF